jgi:hypothetical protein
MEITASYQYDCDVALGDKKVKVDDFIIDEILNTLDVSATINFDFNFKYITEIQLMNIRFDDYETTDKYHLDFIIEVKEIIIEENMVHSDLFCEMIEEEMEDFEKLVGVNFDRDAQGVAYVKDKMAIFYWLNFDSPGFGFSKPINGDYKYEHLFELTQEIEKFVDNIVKKIGRV